MCGIIGFSGTANMKVMESMNQTIVHRGPDDDGYYADEFMNLGMRRLSIVDLESGKQPICNEDCSIWVVFNGEIYNHLELRKGLEQKGHRFRTHHSDTEVVVHLYEEYGEKWPQKVNGMFGLALWDKKKMKLFLYRDRIGKKPLYYAYKNGGIVFASEIKAILKHPAVSKDLDSRALYQYFGLKNISAPRTAFEDIKQVLPGSFVIWRDGGIETQAYWRLNFSSPLEDITEKEAADHLFELFEDAVKIRMQCDVPFGAYLSGGVDSSSVVAIMGRHHSRKVTTFCLGYEDQPNGQFAGKMQDIYYAREMSRRLGTDHHEFIITADQFAETMPAVLSAFDEPFSGTVSTYFLSILIKEHVKVALSGDGADELFGSYLAHRLAFPIEKYMELTKRVQGPIEWRDLSEEEKLSFRPFDSREAFLFLQSIASSNISAWRNSLSVFNDTEKQQLLTEEFLVSMGNPPPENIYEVLEQGLTAKDTLNKSLEIDQKELLPNQVLPFVDRLSMAHSIEVRVPYLDYRIIEFANRLPGKLKIMNGVVKHVHKLAMERLLQRELAERPKEGFVQPIYSWMHGRLKGWTLEIIEGLPREVFNLRYVRDLINAFRSGNQDVNAKIWNLACFGLWFRGLSHQ